MFFPHPGGQDKVIVIVSVCLSSCLSVCITCKLYIDQDHYKFHRKWILSVAQSSKMIQITNQEMIFLKNFQQYQHAQLKKRSNRLRLYFQTRLCLPMAWFASKMFKICMEDRDASIKNPVCLVGVFHKHNLCNPDSDLDSLDYLDS